MKNALAILFTSQGIPMLLSGDEVARTQQGNNNTYCQDNELSWFDWDQVDDNAELLRFTRQMIAFRRHHRELRSTSHPTGRLRDSLGLPDISWHGERAWQPDWSQESRLLAVARCGAGDEDVVYVAMNSHWEAHDLELPALPGGRSWHLFADTGAEAPHDIRTPGTEQELDNAGKYLIGPRSVVILVGRANDPDPRGD
ncbi:hypothetical protein [Streptomyces sp. NPDC048551]